MSWDCQRVQEHAYDAAAGLLRAEELVQQEAHAQGCEECRLYLSTTTVFIHERRNGRLEPQGFSRIQKQLRLDAHQAARSRRRNQRLRAWLTAKPLWIAAPLMAAALWVLIVNVMPSHAPVEDEVVGRVAKYSGQSIPLGELSARIGAGAEFTTGADEELALVFVGERVLLRGSSHLFIETLRTTEHAFTLKRGQVLIDADPSVARRLRVNTGFGTVTVRGTLFEVDVEGAGKVTTLRGRVDVDLLKGGMNVAVPAGRRLLAEDGRVIPYDPEPKMLTILEDAPWWEDAAVGMVHIQGNPPGATVSLDGKVVGQSPLVVRWPPGPLSYEMHWHDGSHSGAATVDANGTTSVAYDSTTEPAAEVDVESDALLMDDEPMLVS
ncbi:MAG: FecR domain-containing protein [Myxococcota bacterium]